MARLHTAAAVASSPYAHRATALYIHAVSAHIHVYTVYTLCGCKASELCTACVSHSLLVALKCLGNSCAADVLAIVCILKNWLYLLSHESLTE